MNNMRITFRILSLMIFGVISLHSMTAESAPLFARQYGISCAACHSAFPKLNDFGKQFQENNYRLPNWKETTVQTGDDDLALPKYIPLAIRAQAFVQGRDAEAVDVVSGEVTEADTDIQAPYLIKLISMASLPRRVVTVKQ
jgi:hypothetical protein